MTARRTDTQKRLERLKESFEKLRLDSIALEELVERAKARAKRVEAHYAEHPAVENVHIGRDGNGRNCILIELRDNDSAQPKLIPLASQVEGMKVYVEVISASPPTPVDAENRAQPSDPSTIAQAVDESVKPDASKDASAHDEAVRPSDDTTKS
jgi:hypothetical protein